MTVNAIAPGGIETDMSRDVMTEEYRARRLAELPLRRFGSVEDVAYCAVVLAAGASAHPGSAPPRPQAAPMISICRRGNRRRGGPLVRR